jgi:iron complex outermembrane receptor protein
MRTLFTIFIFTLFLHANDLQKLLQEYDESSKNSLHTLDEKMGHVVVYTQEKLYAMQYKSLSDILKELPVSNLNTNRFGLPTLSSSGTKTDVSGFFRLYINDHEVSFPYTQNPSFHWIDLPVSLINHIEVYYGEGSFTLGNTTGMQFIRVYTKDAKKENGNVIETYLSDKSNNTQSYTHANVLQNGWSYLLHATNRNDFNEKEYQTNKIPNDSHRQYLFFSASDETSFIDMAYSKLKKDSYIGYATDLAPDEGDVDSENFFIHASSYLLDDRSLKASFSYDVNRFNYYEKNDEGLFIPAVIDLTNFITTMPKEYREKLEFRELNGFISKNFRFGNHLFFAAINYKNKSYETKHRQSTNLFGATTQIGKFNDFTRENVYSLMLQEDYRFSDSLHFIAEYKYDKYDRSGSILQNDEQHLYRFGGIYLPTENFGLKAFYTKSHIAPTFYNIDFADKTTPSLKTQRYKYYNIESVYLYGDSKFSLDYYNVHIDDFIYYTPIGFINVENRVKTNGFIFDYVYSFDKNHKIALNYHYSRVNRNTSNSNKGGYVKYTATEGKFDYFASLIYKNGYTYLDQTVSNSYNVNLGIRYNHTKNLSFTVSGHNLLNKPTKSIVTDTSNGFANQTNHIFSDDERAVTFGVRWVF